MDQEKQEPPAYGDVANSQSDPTFQPGTTNQPLEYVPPAQPCYAPQQPYYPQQTGAPLAYPTGVQPVGVYTAQAPGATVIIRQPTGPMPNDYLIFAIFVTFCCCLPCGIVAIVKASETKNRWHAGDIEGANRNSQEAKKWAMISLVSGIITDVCVAAIVIVYYVFIVSSFYN